MTVKHSGYMYQGYLLTGQESFQLQKRSINGELVCEQQPTNLSWQKVFKLTDKVNGEYCFIFSDEAGLFSGPYPTPEEAVAGLQFYAKEIKRVKPSPDKVWSPIDPNTLMNRA